MSRLPRIAGLLRVAALCTVLSIVAVVAWAIRAYAHGEQVLTQLGEPVMRYLRADSASRPQPIELNGARGFFSHGSSPDPVALVLDQFHAECKRANPAFAAQWADFSNKLGADWSPPILSDGVFRSEMSEGGMLACFDSSAPPRNHAELRERLNAVSESGDLARLGDIRYVRVERTQHGSSYLAMWSEGALNVREMFPLKGDAPGDDPVGIPRPTNTRRTISVAVPGRSEELAVYTAKGEQDAAQLTSSYRAQFERAGFRFLEPEKAQGKAPAKFFVATDGRRMATVAVGDDGQGHGTVTLVSRLD